MHYGSYEFTLLELILGCLFWCSGNLCNKKLTLTLSSCRYFSIFWRAWPRKRSNLSGIIRKTRKKYSLLCFNSSMSVWKVPNPSRFLRISRTKYLLTYFLLAMFEYFLKCCSVMRNDNLPLTLLCPLLLKIRHGVKVRVYVLAVSMILDFIQDFKRT